CACITTRTVGIEELVDDGLTGFIVEHGAIEAAAGAVIGILDGTLPSARIGDAAHDFISAEFDHEHNVFHLVGLWRKAGNRSSPVATPESVWRPADGTSGPA